MLLFGTKFQSKKKVTKEVVADDIEGDVEIEQMPQEVMDLLVQFPKSETTFPSPVSMSKVVRLAYAAGANIDALENFLIQNHSKSK